MEATPPGLTVYEEPVFIVAPHGRDALGASLLLQKAGITSRTFASVETLSPDIDEQTGILVIAEEALTSKNLDLLSAQLERQPIWSDLPVIILTCPQASRSLLERSATGRLAEVLGNIIFLERPLHGLTLVSAVKSGLRARKRQFQIREYILGQERAARELQLSERKLAESNRELERFATIVSHDLQAPLRKINIFSDYLTKTMQGILTEENLDYFNRIQRSVERMQQLITDLLTLSRVTRKSEQCTWIDLQKIVNAALDELHMDIKQVDGRVEVGPLYAMEADPQQIQQLLINLIGNALKYHRPSVPPIVKVYSEQDFGLVRLIVEDNGIGIKEEYREKIFEIFQRLHGVNEYAGTGIGLAIVRRIVERHGGVIQVESQPDVGSRFIIELPVRQFSANQHVEAISAI